MSFKKKLHKWLKKEKKKCDANEQERGALVEDDAHALAVNASHPDSGNEDVESLVDDGSFVGSPKGGELFEHQIMGVRNEDVWTVVGVWDGYNKFEPKEGLFCGVSSLTIEGLKSEKRQEILESGAVAVFCVCVGVGIVYWKWKKPV